MTTYNLPDYVAWDDCLITLEQYTSTNTLYGGETEIRQFADPRWRCHYRTRPLSNYDRYRLEAWFHSLRGGLNRFRARDVFDCRDPGLNAGTYASGTDTIVINGLQASQPFWEGMKIGIGNDATEDITFHMVAAATAANGSGSASVLVTPSVPAGIHSAGKVVNVTIPHFHAIPIPNSLQVQRSGSRFSVSFDGIQVLK